MSWISFSMHPPSKKGWYLGFFEQDGYELELDPFGVFWLDYEEEKPFLFGPEIEDQCDTPILWIALPVPFVVGEILKRYQLSLESRMNEVVGHPLDRQAPCDYCAETSECWSYFNGSDSAEGFIVGCRECANVHAYDGDGWAYHATGEAIDAV